ncbi:MAG TPA: hypothetical protein DDW52_11715 [Planctomycetaceae bacterium]|nr:hypothetical protein [Planctomycetaceae bacterium]
MYGIENAIFVSHVVGSMAALLFYFLATRHWKRSNFGISDVLITTAFIAAAISISSWFWTVLGSRKEIAPNSSMLLAVSGATLFLISIYFKIKRRRTTKAFRIA